MKKYVLIMLAAIGLTSGSIAAAAADVECGQFRFVDEFGVTVDSYSNDTVTAEIECANNTSDSIIPVMLICEYNNGSLVNLKYEKYTVEAQSNLTLSQDFAPVSTSETGVEIKVHLLSDLKTLDNYVFPAQFLSNSTELAGIAVNDVYITGYDDLKDSYVMQCSGNVPKVEAKAMDGGTKVEVVYPDSLPGAAKINVTSSLGNQRTAEVILYEKESDLSALQGLTYEIDGKEYAVENFDPEQTSYEILLPDNTFYVTMKPEFLSVTDTKMKVLDISHKNKTYGENNVSYSQGQDYTPAKDKPCMGGVVPIKNEETKGVVIVKYGEAEKRYEFTFKAKQPRLTDFTMVGAASDTYKPMFISGAAVNNDGDSRIGADREWAYMNISQNLVGGSMFAMDLGSNRNSGTWFMSNTSGTYFKFTADTPGTIYLVSYTKESNAEFANDGWTTYSNVLPTPVEGMAWNSNDAWATVSRTWNGYNPNSIFMIRYDYSKEADRLDESTFATAGGLYMRYVKYKTFVAGEEVNIYHHGVTGGNNCSMSAIVKWNLD